MTLTASADAVASHADQSFDRAVERLCKYLRTPAISCEPAHAEDVARLAAEVATDLRALGLDAHVRALPGALPLVAASWLGAGPERPTVLVYGHLDLQPVQGEAWTTPPHEPTVVGDRLYARGAADDMGGWVSHLHALQAWLQHAGGLPCNLRLIVEGEEEIGSPNLERYMDAWPADFAADAMILTDCENPAVNVPGLTVSLRGLMELELTCAALSADGHSGLWGGYIPDVSTALATLIARLVDENGRPRVGLLSLPQARRDAAAQVTFDAAVVRRGAHLCDGVATLPDAGRSAAEWMWLQPAITVVATTLPTPDRKKNALRAKASATLSMRVAPGQDPADLRAAVEAELLRDAPGGVRVTVTPQGTPAWGWLYTPQGPAFAAADRAYVKAWGKPLQQVGVGGTIPFVALFGRRFGDLPLVLNGVMDPETTAHGPNESLHLGVFRKAIAANVHLYAELAEPGVLL
ncbi:MAG: M20/M25/M40 family metallo-hydrolase [Myxococcales bacterium]|nr:M20/M25/M40 family metallo-hydrolase [Myxococcales bacterium]